MINVLLFAGLAETAKTASVALPLADGATVGEARAALLERYPEIAGKLSLCFAAVNQKYCTDDVGITAADEVAFIPPVSGG